MRSDRGSGTVLTLALVAVTLMLIGGMSLLARAQSGRGAAQSAADLGALAAAAELAGVMDAEATDDRAFAGLVDGRTGASACTVARDVVAANGASLTGCALLGGGVVRVTAQRPAGVGTATASARAGPGVSEPSTSSSS